MDLTLIRHRLAERLSTVLGEPIYRHPTDSPAAPCGVLHAASDPAYVEPHDAMHRGLATINLVLELLVPYVDPQSAHDQLDEWVPVVIDTLEPSGTSETLDGLVHHCTVRQVSGVAARDVAGTRLLGLEITVAVRTTR
jgi:hypothetical protein